MALSMVSGSMPSGIYKIINLDNGIVAHAADEVSENISLVASEFSQLKTISGTHYSVSCGYLEAGKQGMTVNSMGALTINARKGETITKVVLTYSWENEKDKISASAGSGKLFYKRGKNTLRIHLLGKYIT